MVKILDTTFRDGGHQTNWSFEHKFVENYLKCCDSSGIDFLELGYRNNIDKENKGEFFNCGVELCQKFYQKKGNLSLGVMADTSRLSLDDFTNSKEDYVDFIRLATHPDRIEQTLYYAEELKLRGYEIFIQLMEIPNLKPQHYEMLQNWKSKNILKSLYIADTYGTVQPQEIKIYFDKLRSIGYENISFHAHNNTNNALANTVNAIREGAYAVDVSYNGLGGNLSMTDLFEHLNKNMDYYKTFSYSKNCL